MMLTNVFYFGEIGEKLGFEEEQILIQAKGDSGDLRSFFIDKYPVLKGMTFGIAVDHVLNDHIDINQTPGEVALLPPYSGG